MNRNDTLDAAALAGHLLIDIFHDGLNDAARADTKNVDAAIEQITAIENRINTLDEDGLRIVLAAATHSARATLAANPIQPTA